MFASKNYERGIGTLILQLTVRSIMEKFIKTEVWVNEDDLKKYLGLEGQIQSVETHWKHRFKIILHEYKKTD